MDVCLTDVDNAFTCIDPQYALSEKKRIVSKG